MDKVLQIVQRNNRYRLKPHEIEVLKKLRETDARNVLVIGDLHEPFCLDRYLDFCIKQYKIYNCNQVIFIGDIIENHLSSPLTITSHLILLIELFIKINVR